MMLTIAISLAVALAPVTGRIGVDAVAAMTVKGSPETFDLAGLRLGMTETEAERIIRDRGMTVRRKTRARTFDDRVRDVVNARGGRLQPKGGSVLDSAEMDDGRGGRIMIRMLAWPDGARIASIAYLPPAGTDPAAWKRLLVGRYGPYSNDSGQVDGEGLHLRWCGRAACIGGGGLFRLVADVGPRGGQITLSQPEGTSGQLTQLVAADAARLEYRGTPSF